MTFRNSLVIVCIVTLLLGKLQKVFAEKAPLDPENQHEEMVEGSAVDSGGGQGGYMGASGSFFHGFVATFSVIVVSELGDKTFFIAAIMAMKHPRWTVFIGAISALGVMHVMSAFFGYAITVIPRLYTYYLSSFLFAVFGIKMLREGWKMSPNVSLFQHFEKRLVFKLSNCFMYRKLKKKWTKCKKTCKKRMLKMNLQPVAWKLVKVQEARRPICSTRLSQGFSFR